MIKWVVKRYLNKTLEDLKYQILSLEQELSYADNIGETEEIRLLQIHKEAIWNRNNLEVVINMIGTSKIQEIIKKIKCKHDYEEINQHQIDFGMGKLLYLRCKNVEKKNEK